MLLMKFKNYVLLGSLVVLMLWGFSCTQKSPDPVVKATIQEQSAVKEQVIEQEFDLPYNDSIGGDFDPKIDALSSEPEHTSWKIRDEVIEKLGDIRGQTIADIGAGVGYLSFKLLLRQANVIATDMDSNSIQMINSISIINLNDEQKERFETRLAEEGDPLLLDNEVDKVMMMHLIGFIDNKRNYLANLRKAIKPGGQLMIMDFKMKRLPEGYPTKEYKVYPDELEELLYEIGYDDIVIDDTTLEYEYIIIAQNYK